MCIRDSLASGHVFHFEQRTLVRKAINNAVDVALDMSGAPKFTRGAEVYAAAILILVEPHNYEVIAGWLGRMPTIDDLADDPDANEAQGINAAQMFSLIMLGYAYPGSRKAIIETRLELDAEYFKARYGDEGQS